MRCNSVLLCGLVSAAVMIPAESARAQSLKATFDVVTRSPNYQAYASFDECSAAISRMVSQTTLDKELRTDTAPHNPRAITEPFNDSVRLVGMHCARQGLLDSLPRESAAEWALALLTIQRADQASRVMFALLDSLSPYEGLSVTMELFRQLGKRRPLNVNFVEQLYERVNRAAPRDSIYKLALLRGVRAAIYTRINDENVRSARMSFFETLDSMPDWAGCPDDARKQLIALAVLHRVKESEDVWLDSLATGTDAYKRHLVTQFVKVSKGRVDGALAHGEVGEEFPRATGDYWFESHARPPFTDTSYTSATKFHSTKSTVRPVRGKINLVARLGSNCHVLNQAPPWGRGVGVGFKDRCEQAAAVLRRLLIRHPDVELSIWVQARGGFGPYVEPDPEAEAHMWARYVFDHYRLPGTLFVEKVESYRLESPDNRRIDEPTTMVRSLLDLGVRMQGSQVALVDQDGRIVTIGFILDEEEEVMHRKILALKRRNHATGLRE